jgi:hypothetical protein
LVAVARQARGKVLHHYLERILGEGDDVVVITKITAGGECGLQADVLTYRSGKLVKAVSIADTALQERVFGTK